MIPIVFENDYFLVVDKPGGYLSVPSQWGEEDPRPCVNIELTKILGHQVWPVHRLDLDVTGIMLFAKDPVSHRIANDWFESRDIQKTYEALTEGVSPSDAKPGQFFEWSSKLHRGKKRSFVSPHGKLAVTRAYWLESVTLGSEIFQRWKLDPLTGRPHQLRVELSQHGFPIVGDKLYGATKDFLPSTLALRAVELDFSHCPKAKEKDLPAKVQVSGLMDLWKSRN